jgi:hypothetical protein
VGVGTYKGYETRWYGSSGGSHTLTIASNGYYTYTHIVTVCSGKPSYVYYDQASHLYAGLTRTTTTTETTTTAEPVTTTFAGQSTDYGAVKGALGTTAPSKNLGSLSVTTDPDGASIFIDGVQQGISPATVPGLTPGSHTLLLKRDGYQDLTIPVVISAGGTQYYSSALMKIGAVAGAGTTPTKKSSAPGFGAAFATCIAGVLLLRKTNS